MPGVGDEVAAVADRRPRRGQPLPQLAVDPRRMDRVGVGLELGLARPRAAPSPRRAAWRSRARGRPAAPVCAATPSRIGRQVAGGRHRRVDVAGALSGWSTTCTTWAAPKEPNDSRKSSGVPTTTTTSACLRKLRVRGERQLVVGGQAPAALAVDERRHPQRLDAAPQRLPRAVGPDVAARHEHRPLGAGDERGRARPRRRGRARARRASPPSGTSACVAREHDVEREVEEDRPPVRRERERDRLVQLLGDLARSRSRCAPPW